MKLEDLIKLGEREKFYISTQERDELKNGENKFYKLLRENGFYRVYETYYKDCNDCTQFYCTGFTNSELGYKWLLAISNKDETDDIDLEKTIFDLYVVTKGNSKWERKDKKVFTGTAKQILEFSKRKDKEGYKIAVRQNEVDEVFEKLLDEVKTNNNGILLEEVTIPPIPNK